MCPECGMPAGQCYNICPSNYSPDQERADDAFYGADDQSERYAATAADADLFTLTEWEADDVEFDHYAGCQTDDVPNYDEIPF